MYKSSGKKRLSLTFLLLLFMGQFSLAQSDSAGIYEHLGNIVPGDLTFTNEQNRQLQLKDLITQPTILSFVYYNCQGVCPMILSGVTDVIENMNMEMGKDFRVITVSFDPSDTPERSLEKKKEFMRKKSLMHPNDWTYLTGDSASISKILLATGYIVKRQGNDFMHPAGIIILSPEGKITRYLYGTNYLPFDLKMALVEARKGLSRPTINRVLEYCFSYDPDGRRYTLQVTKIAASIIIFLAVILFVILLVRSGRSKRKIIGSAHNQNQS